MLSDQELMRQMRMDFPQLDMSADPSEEKKTCTPFYALSAHANELMERGEWDRLKECMDWVSRQYGESSEQIRTYIENIFVFKVGEHALISRQKDRLMAIMPGHLKHLLVQQFIVSGI